MSHLEQCLCIVDDVPAREFAKVGLDDLLLKYVSAAVVGRNAFSRIVLETSIGSAKVSYDSVDRED